ncbi:hypothetical protein AVEN_263574-1 [Araneus ventricosus]|uniref:Uncharacterized protein n=1 Tax=Araneus ventricosus TaxID=182803 RepID=A0A4Y2HTJ1_ARAVE|nr:hypothetical protein AVEN_263574-1 [Araneus ventricosus]
MFRLDCNAFPKWVAKRQTLQSSEELLIAGLKSRCTSSKQETIFTSYQARYSIRIYTKIVDRHQILDRILQLEAFRLLIHVHVNMETPKINDLDGLNLPNHFITRIAALYKIFFKIFQ